MHHGNRFSLFLIFSLLLILPGCTTPHEAEKEYDRPLPPGMNGLRKIHDPADWPETATAFDRSDTMLVEAIDRSLAWFEAPSSKTHFPVHDVTHLRARTSVYAFRELLNQSRSPAEFRAALEREFDCYMSVGWDRRGTVLFTGYYAPIFKASRTPDATYRYPLYRQPDDLVKAADGRIEGRRLADGSIAPYPTRAELESSNTLAGLELVYLPTRLDAYIIHVNGSAKLELTDGSAMYVGYAANNGHEYTSIRAALVEDEKIGRHDKLAAIKAYFDAHPQDLATYMNRNDRFVFFAEYDGGSWPAGSLGFPVTGYRSLATDKNVFPRAGVVMVDTTLPAGHATSTMPFKQFMLDQDTGGAIRAPGRGDLFLGIGPAAERLAGAQAAEGQLYYWFLKHDRVLDWHRKMTGSPPVEPTTGATPAAPTTAPSAASSAPLSEAEKERYRQIYYDHTANEAAKAFFGEE